MVPTPAPNAGRRWMNAGWLRSERAAIIPLLGAARSQLDVRRPGPYRSGMNRPWAAGAMITFSAVCLAAAAGAGNQREQRSGWDAHAAAAYLDKRADWWLHWPTAAARSRNRVRVVPYRAAVRAGAAGAPRTLLPNTNATAAEQLLLAQRHQARDAVERGRTVLSGSDARPAENERVARHRGGDERADPRLARCVDRST